MSVSLIDVHFVWLRTFERTAKGLLSDDDEREIEKDIAEAPEAAPIITATGGVPGLCKNVRENISKAEKRTIRAMVERLRHEQGSVRAVPPRGR